MNFLFLARFEGLYLYMNTRIFIANVPYSATENDILISMSKAGKVVKFERFLDESGRFRGCGLVEFTSKTDPRVALEVLNGTTVRNRSITAKADLSKRKSTTSKKVIRIDNMPASVTWQ